jgi:purine-cytosine permease-like protein
MKLLDFVALYGLILIPMGGVIFADHYLLERWGLKSYFAEKHNLMFNWSAGATWFLMLALALIMNLVYSVELYFLPVPVWILSVIVYVLFSRVYQKNLKTA